jgi:hypothetical protein
VDIFSSPQLYNPPFFLHSVSQLTAGICAHLTIVTLWFFLFLLQHCVRQYDPRNGDLTKGDRTLERANCCPPRGQLEGSAGKSNVAENKKLIKKAKERQEAEYFSRINDPVRKLASTSLYAAYEYEWRFWKLIQL